jgi:hypothetical protein
MRDNNKDILLFFFFSPLVVLGVEFRVLNLLCRCSTSLSHIPPALLFALVIFCQVFAQGWPQSEILLCSRPPAKTIDLCYYPSLLVSIGGLLSIFALADLKL